MTSSVAGLSGRGRVAGSPGRRVGSVITNMKNDTNELKFRGQPKPIDPHEGETLHLDIGDMLDETHLAGKYIADMERYYEDNMEYDEGTHLCTKPWMDGVATYEFIKRVCEIKKFRVGQL
jgi:hypothetical protein